jgi:hypothetical protein
MPRVADIHTAPGTASVIPVPTMIEHAEPFGVI